MADDNSEGIPISYRRNTERLAKSVNSSVRSPFGFQSFSVQPPFILRSSSVQPPFNLRSSSVQAPFKLRSSSVRAPFILRSSSVQAPFELRSSSVQAPFELRSGIEDRSKIDRRMNGESSEARRRCIETLMGNQGKGDPNKSFIFNHLNSNYYGKTYWNSFQSQRFCRSLYF